MEILVRVVFGIDPVIMGTFGGLLMPGKDKVGGKLPRVSLAGTEARGERSPARLRGIVAGKGFRSDRTFDINCFDRFFRQPVQIVKLIMVLKIRGVKFHPKCAFLLPDKQGNDR